MIRPERPEDYEQIDELITRSFKVNGKTPPEVELVNNLRHSANYIPELCLVSEVEGQLVGHIFYSKLEIENNPKHQRFVALAPVCVLPEQQKRGIGSALIRKSIEIAVNLNYSAIVVVGHESYYPKFGFEPLNKYAIKIPFDVPPQNAMILRLKCNDQDTAIQCHGMLHYDPVFFLGN